MPSFLSENLLPFNNSHKKDFHYYHINVILQFIPTPCDWISTSRRASEGNSPPISTKPNQTHIHKTKPSLVNSRKLNYCTRKLIHELLYTETIPRTTCTKTSKQME